MNFSIVVPAYNRPDEVHELLESLTHQSYKEFEVLIVEDGSTDSCEGECDFFQDLLNVKYLYQENTGQGFARNYGFSKASGDYFIVFDSDCIIPPDYMKKVNNHLQKKPLDAYGGPDRAHSSFNNMQKAISYSMTSFFTTGGIRGNKQHIGQFHPRSFNMGISREVFEKTGGYAIPKMGEDIEFSSRIIRKGFNTGLIEDAVVYHKRRTNFKQFFRQLSFFGKARINLFRFYKDELKLIHFLPSLFLIFCLCLPIGVFLPWPVGFLFQVFIPFYSILVFVDSALKNNSFLVGFLSVYAAFVQLWGYGSGFIAEGIRYIAGDREVKIRNQDFWQK